VEEELVAKPGGGAPWLHGPRRPLLCVQCWCKPHSAQIGGGCGIEQGCAARMHFHWIFELDQNIGISCAALANAFPLDCRTRT
jgi:hypothetical protein